VTLGPFTIREEQRLSCFENMVLKKIFGSEREKVTGDWMQLRNEELHGLYCSTNFIEVIKQGRMRRVGHVAWEREEKHIQNFGGETE
jgi:hypothetical protein